MALREGSLRGRVTAAYVLLGIVISSFFAALGFILVQQVERGIVAERLAATAEWWEHTTSYPMLLPPSGTICDEDSCPEHLRSLEPGFYEPPDGDPERYVFVRVRPDGKRIVVADAFGDFERLEREFLIGLGIGIVFAAALSVFLGRATAGRVIRPLSELATWVSSGSQDKVRPVLEFSDEIGTLARIFAAQTEQLRTALSRERLFTGDVSHELRTPLTVLQGIGEVMAQRFAHQPETQAEIERFMRTVRELSDTVSALLLLSRAPERLDTPRLELLPLVEWEIERCRPLLLGKDVTLDFSERAAVVVRGRKELAAMAIGNLLRNACLYTEKGRVTLRLHPDRLVVEDSGPGLSPLVRERLFERHVRGDETDSASGSGFGLALVLRVCEHLGWSISYEAAESRGSRFTLLLPIPGTDSHS